MKKRNVKPKIQAKSKLSDIVEFTRQDNTYRGRVIMLRENSVIVEFLEPSAHIELSYENNKTVVSHQNYRVIRKTASSE
jgi:uncharacterized protein YkvS